MLFTFHKSLKEGYRITNYDGYMSINSIITMNREHFDALFFAMEAFYADEEVTKQLEEANANSEERN